MAESERAGRTRQQPTVAEARAAAEAAREQQRSERNRSMREAFGDRPPGRAVMAASWLATAVLAGISLLTLVDDGFLATFFVVTFAMFVLGALLFALDVVLAAARSTTHTMGIGGLFFLLDSAPRRVVLSLNGSLCTAVVVAVVTAVVGLSTPELAFGTLAPLLQVSLSGLWAVRHGLFPDRAENPGGGRAR